MADKEKSEKAGTKETTPAPAPAPANEEAPVDAPVQTQAEVNRMIAEAEARASQLYFGAPPPTEEP